MEKRTPIRMCISCRKKEPQGTLFRLQKKKSSIIRYSGRGRSFYICKKCFNDIDRTIKKIKKNLKINNSSIEVVLKELKSNVKD